MAMEEVMQPMTRAAQPSDNPNPVPMGQDESPVMPEITSAPGSAEVDAEVDLPEGVTRPPDALPTPGGPAAAPAAAMAPAMPASVEDAEAVAEQARLEEALANISKSMPTAAREVQQNDDEVAALISDLQGQLTQDDELNDPTIGVVRSLENEPFWQGLVRTRGEDMKLMVTKMRESLASTPAEKAQVFSAMYGEDNVRLKGDTVQFRPNDKQKWRNMDAATGDKMIDYGVMTAFKVFPMLLNMGTQAALTSVSSGVGSILGGAAAGGAVQAAATGGAAALMDSALSIDPGREEILGEIAKESGYSVLGDTAFLLAGSLGRKVGGVAAAVGNTASKIPQVKRASDAISDSLGSIVKGAKDTADEAVTWADEKLLSGAGWANQKYAQVREGFNQYREVFFPDVPKVASKEAAQNTMNAMDVAQQRLGKKIEVYKDEALALADEKAIRSQTPQAIKTLKEILTENKYYIDPDDGFAKITPGADQTLEQTGVTSAMKTMAATYNRLVQSAAHGEFGAPGATARAPGTSLQRLFSDIDETSKLAAYNKLTDAKEKEGVAKLWKRVDGGFREDRNNLMTQAFEGAQSPYAKQWQSDFKQFHENAGSLANVKATFRTPQDLEAMVTTLAHSSGPDQVELLDNMATVLGKDSQEFMNLKGSVYDSLVSRFTKATGEMDTAGFLKYMNSPKNSPTVDRLFDKQEKEILNHLAVEADNITKRVLTAEGRGRLVKGTAYLAGLAVDPVNATQTLFKMFRGDVKTINWLRDEGFAEAARKAEGPAIKKRLLEMAQKTEDMVNHMAVVDVPVYMKDGAKRSVKMYAPFAGPALSAIGQEAANQD